MNALTTSRLDEIAATITREHAEIETAMRESMARAVKIGSLLIEAKQLVKHGEWGTWLKANCTFSERTAQNYMRISARYPELEKSATVADLTYREAIALLAEPKTEGVEPRQEQITPPSQDYMRDLIYHHAEGLTAEIRRIRKLASDQARFDVPGTRLAQNRQAAARIEMQRACGRWINSLENQLGKDMALEVIGRASHIAEYAAYSAAHWIIHKVLPKPPQELGHALGQILGTMEMHELDNLGEDCVTALTVADDSLCEIPEQAREAFHGDPVRYHVCNLIFNAFAEVPQ